MLGWFKRTFGKKKDEPAAEPVPAEPTVAESAEQLAPPAEVEAVVAAAEPTQSPEPAEVAAEPLLRKHAKRAVAQLNELIALADGGECV